MLNAKAAIRGHLQAAIDIMAAEMRLKGEVPLDAYIDLNHAGLCIQQANIAVISAFDEMGVKNGRS